MGCWFSKKDASQLPSELNDIHLQITNKSKEGPISSENHGNGLFLFFFILIFYLNK
jgi:hypothetical protein